MKKFLALSLTLAMTLSLAACGGSKPAETTAAPAPAATEAAAAATEAAAETKAAAETPAKGSIQIKYSTWAGDGEAAYEGMKKFKEYIEADSNGVIEVLLYPSDQAGSTNEQVEQVSMNQLQMMSSGDPGVKEIEYLCLPYLFDSLDKYTDFLASDVGQKYLQEGIKSRNTRIIDTLPRSPRIISSNIEINSLADMKNMKIRSPEKDYYVETFKALGANPTPMAMGEIYSAMQTGVVEGQENPIETIVSYGFQNVNKYLVMSNHIIKPAFVMINNDFFTGLAPEYQEMVLDCCKRAREYANEYMVTAMERDLQTCLDAGMKVCEPDLAEWKEATQSVRDTLGVQVWGEDGYAAIKEIAAK